MCISILHEPGEDKWGYEKPEERWLPIHTVETILISVISMLADPNDESPANVDAAVSLLLILSRTLKDVTSYILSIYTNKSLIIYRIAWFMFYAVQYILYIYMFVLFRCDVYISSGFPFFSSSATNLAI